MNNLRSIPAFVLSATGLLLAASNAAAAEAARTVNVYGWAGYIASETLARFEQQTGIRVKYDSFDSADILEAKLLTGHSGYDVVVPGVAMLDRLIRAKALQPTAMQQYKAAGQYDAQLLGQLAQVDPGNLYAVPYAWGTTGLAYNQDAVEKRIPGAPLNSFDLLFKPEYASKLKDCGIAIIDSPQEVMSIALHYLGKNPYSQSSADYGAAKQLLEQLRPNLRYIAFGKQSNDLANGDLCLALTYNGDAVVAKGQATAAGKPFTVGYQIPREGTLAWIDTLAIPADAPHAAEAKAFIEFVTDAESMAEMTNALYYANANRASIDRLPTELREDETLFPSAERRQTLFGEEPLPARTLRERTRVWAGFRTQVGE
ncbi:extracellular solute-binding protein [Pseudomonas sp. ML96]|uniref:extracellular solute-binding protein n=1 Tax=Pseudomonas sp. ML96 TaxID=1523503 RepID=UPI00068FDF7D|nr:extracellular solute-binding protein [Pseudomonas sp. ML96]